MIPKRQVRNQLVLTKIISLQPIWRFYIFLFQSLFLTNIFMGKRPSAISFSTLLLNSKIIQISGFKHYLIGRNLRWREIWRTCPVSQDLSAEPQYSFPHFGKYLIGIQETFVLMFPGYLIFTRCDISWMLYFSKTLFHHLYMGIIYLPCILYFIMVCLS